MVRSALDITNFTVYYCYPALQFSILSSLATLSSQTRNLRLTNREMDKSIITTVIKRFPQYWDRIRRLGESDRKFCSLCNDYFLAHEALNLWRTSKAPDVIGRVQEYQVVVEELEVEIEQYLVKETKEYG